MSSAGCLERPVPEAGAPSDEAFLARIDRMVKRNSPSCVPKKLLLVSSGSGTGLRKGNKPPHHDAESFDVAKIGTMLASLFLASISGLEGFPCEERRDGLALHIALWNGEVYFPRYGSLLPTVLGI